MSDSSYTQAIKLGVTVGPIVPNPAYYVGNALGGLFQMQMGMGAAGTARALFRNPEMVASVTARLFGNGISGVNHVIVGKDGRIYTTNMLAELAKTQGLDTSFVGSEITRDLLLDIKRKHYTGLSRIKSLGAGVVDWQRTLIEVATAQDNVFRLSIFVDAIVDGDSPTAAAAKAREIGYDYSRLTTFEKTVMRSICLFYSFLKVNTLFFIHQFFKNPSRVMGQFRLLRGMMRLAVDDEEPDLLIPEHASNRAMIAANNAMGEDVAAAYSRTSAKTKGYIRIVPPLPAPDALAFMVDLPMALTGDQDAAVALVQQLHPALQMVYVAASSNSPMSGRELREDVPHYFVQLDRNLFSGYITDDMLGVSVDTDKDGRSIFVPSEQGQRVFFVLNAGLSFVPGMGRSMSTFEAMDRADMYLVEGLVQATAVVGRGLSTLAPDDEYRDVSGINPASARVGMTRLDEALAVVGVKKIEIPTRRAVMTRLERDRKRRLQEAIRIADRAQRIDAEYRTYDPDEQPFEYPDDQPFEDDDILLESAMPRTREIGQ
jgi:hypothetical protein